MSSTTLTPLSIQSGIWEGLLVLPAQHKPRLKISHLNQDIQDFELTQTNPPHEWSLKITIPKEAISEGVQTILIQDAKDDALLGHFSLISGQVLSEDICAELDLLRAELDMLKRAFRRHCLEG